MYEKLLPLDMGLALSAVISYAGVLEALQCVDHILSGLVPPGEPDFRDLAAHYTELLRRAAAPAPAPGDWRTACGQGYLALVESDGRLKSATVNYYDGPRDSTALLFSTKISSFGDSVEETRDRTPERYTPTKTKTILTTASETFSVANRNSSPGADRLSPARSFEPTEPAALAEPVGPAAPPALVAPAAEDAPPRTERLTWQYTPLRPAPDIHLESFDDDDDKPDFFSEDHLRSLDGIKYRPLQRSDPSGRRRSFRKRHSSSSTSSRESRASRDEELQIFSSLEEAECGAPSGSFGSAPNLSPRSDSRSRSRERPLPRSAEPPVPAVTTTTTTVTDSAVDLLDSIDALEPKDEVIDQEVDDFWGNSGD